MRVPWVLLPVLPLFACSWQILADVGVAPSYLLVPLAAWLGRRYGVLGIVTVAVGGIAALFPSYQAGPFNVGGMPDVYIIALWVSIACAADDPPRALIGSWKLFRSSFAFAAALVLFPISLSLGAHQFEDGGALSLWVGLRPLLLFGLFLFGLAGFPPKHAIVGLVLATVIGIAIRYFEIDDQASAAVAAQFDPDAPWINNFSIRYRLDDLAGLATGLGYFFAGRLVDRRRAGVAAESAFWRHPYLTIVGLTLLASAGIAVGLLLRALPPAFERLGVYGDYYALPIAAFLAGFLLHYRGIAINLVLFVAVVAGGNLAAIYLGPASLSASLEQPLFCLAFGMLGLRLRDLMDGTTTTFKAKRWVQYAGLVLGILAIVTSASEVANLAKAIAIAVGGALLALLAQWVRRALDRRGIRITGDGWLLLGAIIVVLIWIAFNLSALAAMAMELAEDWDMPGGLAIVVMIVLLNIPLALLAAGLARCLPKVWSDIRLMRGR
jgi:hypothetical protein